jgi:hypothetical protein
MDYTKILLHVASYVSGGVMVVVGALAELGMSFPGIAVDNPKTVVATGAGIIAAAVKGDQAAAVAGWVVAALLGSFLLAGPAEAADLKLVTKAAPAVYDPIGSGGWYVGVGSQLETAKATIGSTDVLSQSGALGVIGGYGRGNGVSWWQGQVEAYYQNLSGSGFCGLSAPCGVSSKFSGAAVVKFGGPVTSVLLNALPQVSSLFPGLSPTAIATNVFPYIGGVVNFEDMSGTFGDANARDWRFPIGLRLGAITKLTNGTVSDAGAEVDFAGSGFALGKASVNPGVAYKAYLHFAFGA